MKRALILDTETTDLIYNRSVKMNKLPYVIEYYGAVINLANGEILSEIDTLVKPPISIPDVSKDITGITDEMVASAKPFGEIATMIRDQIEACPLVIAHNASFDQEMIDIEFERLGQTKIAWPQLICTVEATAYMKGFRLSLSALHEHLFGSKFSDAHRAKPDTQALIRCVVELNKRGVL